MESRFRDNEEIPPAADASLGVPLTSSRAPAVRALSVLTPAGPDLIGADGPTGPTGPAGSTGPVIIDFAYAANTGAAVM